MDCGYFRQPGDSSLHQILLLYPNSVNIKVKIINSLFLMGVPISLNVMLRIRFVRIGFPVGHRGPGTIHRGPGPV